MKMGRRLEALEARSSPDAFHVLRVGSGCLDDPAALWQAKEDAALDAYGRDRISPADRVIAVRFIASMREDAR